MKLPLVRCLSLLLCATLLAPSAGAKPRKKKAHATTSQPDTRGEYANFVEWQSVNQFIDQMVEKHQFDKAELQALMRQVHYVDSAIKLIRPAPQGHNKNWQQYRKLLVDATRIAGGVAFWQENAATLAQAEAEYGVPAEIIVAILGIETVYGRNVGNFRVIDVITTLAFAYPATPKQAERSAFFRGELEHTLLFAREMTLDPFSLLGSYAGAIGLPQFMPGSIRQFAVDFDQDGKIDLRRSRADAIGSIAHYLQQHGWQRGGALVFPATVWPAEAGQVAPWDTFLHQELAAKFTLAQLRAAGVNTALDLPPDQLLGLIDLPNGSEATEYWLGAPNFFALTQYNRSYFYAMSVVELGRRLRQLRGQ
jgi:membrane-bound lytic murein transglycosylase B